MKVTALIPDNIVHEVKKYANGKTLTESIVVALEEWIALKKIKNLNKTIQEKPLQFIKSFSGESIRSLNRK